MDEQMERWSPGGMIELTDSVLMGRERRRINRWTDGGTKE